MNFQTNNTQQHQHSQHNKNGLAKNGLAKVNHNRFLININIVIAIIILIAIIVVIWTANSRPGQSGIGQIGNWPKQSWPKWTIAFGVWGSGSGSGFRVQVFRFLVLVGVWGSGFTIVIDIVEGQQGRRGEGAKKAKES